MAETRRLLNLGFVARRIVSTAGKVVEREGVAAAMAEGVLAAIHPSHQGYIAVFVERGLYLEVEIASNVTQWFLSRVIGCA